MPADTERSLLGRIAANERWSHEPDRTRATSSARAAFLAKFEDEVDPQRVLPPGERARRAESARKAHFQRLALKSAQARRRAREAMQVAEETEAELLRGTA